jgi:ribosome recycling factor
MKKNVLLGVAGGALLVVGVLAGMIFGDNIRALAAGAGNPAAKATQGDRASYCQLYIQTLASDLGVTTDKLKSANQDAAQKVIDQLAKDGKITTDQKNQMTQALQKHASNPCAFVNVAAAHKGLTHDFRQGLAPARAAVESAVAGALKISTNTLESDLAAGQTIPQIAAAQKVSLSDVNTAYLNAVKSQLSSAVGSGAITQDQSNAIYSRVQQAVQNGRYPLLGMGVHR